MSSFETPVPLAEVKNKLSQFVERVAKGEIIIITKHGEPAAKLSSVEGPSREERERAIREIRALRAANPVNVTTEELIEWKNAGRP